jgi:hypothetical protein
LSDDDGGEREKNVKGQPVPIADVVGEVAPAPVVEEFEETMIVEKILGKRLKDVKVMLILLLLLWYTIL